MAAISNNATKETSRTERARSSSSTARSVRPVPRRRRRSQNQSEAVEPQINSEIHDLDIDNLPPSTGEFLAPEFAQESGRSEQAAAGKKTSRAIQHAESTSFLAMYFREMATLDVLKPEQEFSAAREIEALEIALWEAILSHPSIYDNLIPPVVDAIGDTPDTVQPLLSAATEVRNANSPTAQDQWTDAVRACAEALRSSDTDKQYLEVALSTLRHIENTHSDAADSGAKHELRTYVTRVRRAERAASRARNNFVKANLRLVVSIARRFNHGRMSLADLIQEGNLGLMKAVERYDYRRGFRFSTYASWWIRHAISRALADKGREVRLPVHMLDAHHRLTKASRELTGQLGRQPTSEELAEAAQIPVEKIEKMRTYLVDQSFSLDRPVNDEEGRPFFEFLRDPADEDSSPVDVLELQALTDEVRMTMNELKPIEADILRQRFGLDNDQELTLKEIGEKYNLSRERIRQLQEQALTKIRRAFERRNLM